MIEFCFDFLMILFCRALPLLREYILIDQYRTHVDQFILKEGELAVNRRG